MTLTVITDFDKEITQGDKKPEEPGNKIKKTFFLVNNHTSKQITYNNLHHD